MDPITAAIVAALSAGAISGLTETSKAAITDGYNKLKDLLTKKSGASSDVLEALDKLEAKPHSDGHKTVLHEEIATIGAEHDAEILAAAEHLLTLVPSQQGKYINIGGIQNINRSKGDHTTTTQYGRDHLETTWNIGSPPTNNQEPTDYETYIDKMLPTLLNKRFSRENEAARSAVREQTLIVLSQLNGKGKARVLQFLHNGRLLEAQQPIIDLQGADLSEVDLAGVNLSNAALHAVDLRNANLERADLRGADLREAKLDQANLHAAKLESSDLSETWLDHTNLESAKLNKANLRGVYASKANLVMSDLKGADLREAVLLEVDLSSADLSSADLTGAFLGRINKEHGADLRGANLSNTQMSNANLVDANLSRANISNATLEKADLRGVDLRRAKVVGTNLKGADLRGANLTGADIQNAFLSFILPLGTREKQIEEIAQELRLDEAGKKQLVEDLMARGLSADVSIGTMKQLAAKLGAVGTIITEEQLMAAGVPDLTNTNDFVIPYYIPNWAWKGTTETTETESPEVGRLIGWLENRGIPVEGYHHTTIETSGAIILYTGDSRLTAPFMKKLQFESDRSDPPDYPHWQ